MVAVKNCKIYTMCSEIIENGYVLYDNGIITEVGYMKDMPEISAECVIDGKGGYLLPGLIDAHSHLGLFNEGLRIEGEDGNEDTDPITPQLRAIDGINSMDVSFGEALRGGVTTVLTGPGSANPIGGSFAALKTDGICVDDMVINPCVAMKFALGENPKITYNTKERSPVTRMATAAILRETLLKTREYMEKREDPEEDMEFDFKYESLIPVIKGELPVQIHCHRADDIFTAIRISEEFSLKYILVHCTDGHLIADRLKAKNAPIIVGPMLNTRSKPELMGMTAANAAILCKAGNTVALCTDHPEMPQQHLMLSAAMAAKEGLSNEEAFAMVTVNPAKIAGLEHRLGSIAVGKDADMVLYDGHPFDTRTNVKQVIVNGKTVL